MKKKEMAAKTSYLHYIDVASHLVSADGSMRSELFRCDQLQWRKCMKNEKTSRAVLLLFGLALLAASCAKPSAQAPVSAGDMSDVTGIYNHVLTGEDMRDRLVGSWAGVTHLDTLVQYNNLVLTAKNTTITTGDRYELTKDLFNGEMGIHVEARFYGEYIFSGPVVTLKTPEYYTWIYYRNGRIMGVPYVYQPVPASDISAGGVVDPILSAASGASFYGDYLDYHGYHNVQEMTVTVNPVDSTFTFNLAENDDSVDLGAESEDDAFNAGPIFAIQGENTL